MGNLIRSRNLDKNYNINSYPPQIFVVCDNENNPVNFSAKHYYNWKKPKMMYFQEGHAKNQAQDLNKVFGEDLFKVVKFIPEVIE